jgi:hypothetical protein
MSCFLILDNNYVDSEKLANGYVSSANPSFPITNVYNKQRRSKVWRSAGYFNVTSSNNQIIFRETSAGPNLTATITEDEYTSIALMCTAIKTALEAVGDSTYTVTNSSSTNFKFRIVSNGSGGDGVFKLMCTDAGFTASELLGFDDSEDLTGALTYNADILTISTGPTGEEWIKWDLGISSLPSAFIMIGSRNRAIKISPSAVIKLQGNETDEWSAPSFEETLTYDDSVIYALSLTTLHTEALRYWRVLIEDQNPLGYVEVGSVFLGTYFSPERGRAQFPLESRHIDKTEILISEGGQEYTDIREKTQEYSVKWSALTDEDKEYFENFFDQVGTGIPFFLAMDPESMFYSSANKSIKFVKFQSEPTWTLIAPNYYEMTMRFKEQL